MTRTMLLVAISLGYACSGPDLELGQGGQSAQGGASGLESDGGTANVGGSGPVSLGGIDGAAGAGPVRPTLSYEGWRREYNLTQDPSNDVAVVNRAIELRGASPYVVGYDWDFTGFVDERVGTSWRPAYETNTPLLGLWAASPTVLFAVGQGLVVRLESGQAPLEYWVAKGTLSGAWGSEENDIIAVGWSGVIFRFDGEQWLEEPSGTTADLNAVWGSGQDNVFAVGDGGLILHRSSGAWEPMDTGTSEDLLRVWGFGPSDIYAVGGSVLDPGHVILHYDGTAWSAIDHGDSRFSALAGIWGSTSSDIFAVGGYRDPDDNESHAELYHSTGAPFSEIAIDDTRSYLLDIRCPSSAECFVVDNGGGIWRVTF